MQLNILKAKVKRNGLQESAGKYFRDETSEIIESLNKKGKTALVGIQNGNGIYTILGEEFVYYSIMSGDQKEMRIKDFSELLHINALNTGKWQFKWKKSKYEFLKISDQEKIWLHNKSTMESLWNTVLWLEKLAGN